MVTFEILTDEDMNLVHEKTLKVLEKTGIGIDSGPILSMLSEKGCDVDFEKKVVRFKPEIVESALAQAPSSFKLGGFDAKHDMRLGAGNSYICSDGQGLFTVDLASGERRESRMADLVDACKIIDEMDYISCDWPTVTANDVPDGMRTIRELIEMWRVSSKHIQSDCYNEAQAKCYLAVLDAIFGRERVVANSPFSACCCPVSPLAYEGPMLEGTIALGEANVPVVLMAAPITGTTAPMSVFSEVIQVNVELLAGLTILELAHPGRRVIYAISADAMDMQTNLCLEGSAEGLLADLGCIQMAKRYHLPSMGAMATDAHVPGVQSGMERALYAYAYFMIGVDLMSGVGLTSSSMCLRFDELVFDEDICNIAHHLADGIHTGEENTLTDDLMEVGIGGNFLAEESTVEYLHNGEHYVPKHYKRENYESWKAAGFPDPTEAAAERARKIIAYHDKDNFGSELYEKLIGIVDKADAELAG